LHISTQAPVYGDFLESSKKRFIVQGLIYNNNVLKRTDAKGMIVCVPGSRF
jgi:hypothetical protein